MSSRWIRSSSSISPSWSTITVRRGVANSVLHRGELVLDDGLDAGARAQDVEIVGDLGGELVELVRDLVAAERGQALQAQIEDGLGLLVRQPRRCRRSTTRWRGSSISAISGAMSFAGQSRAIKRFARLVGVLRGADQPDHLVDIGDRDGEADQDMGAVARLVEQELGAPRDHLFAEVDEGRQQVLQVHHLRPAAVERHHVGAEGRSAAA